VILYHNHPSRASNPSHADQAVTRRLKAALSLIDVKIVDHLIVAEKVFSFYRARRSRLSSPIRWIACLRRYSHVGAGVSVPPWPMAESFAREARCTRHS
jgi:hypothetical protein